MKTLLTLIFSALAICANAGTHVWSGAGANSNWNNASNWSSGGAPAAGEAAPVKLIFPANATAFTTSPNINNLKVDAIEVDCANASYLFTTSGIPVTLTGAAGDNFKITGGWGSVTWQPAVTLQSTCRFNFLNGGTALDLQGVVAGSGGIVKTGSGFLKFTTGGSANTFTGTLRLEGGNVILQKIAGTPCFAGPLQIINGACSVYQSHQIPDTSPIEILGGNLVFTPGSGVTSVVETLGNVTIGGNCQIQASQNSTLTFGAAMTFVNDATTLPSFDTSDGGVISLGGGTRTLSIPHPDSQVDFNTVIGDGATSTSIVKSGAGYLRLLKANTFTGTMEVKEGELDIQNANSLGATAKGTTVRAGATLILGTAMILPSAETLTLEGELMARYSAEVPGPVLLAGTPSFSAPQNSPLRLTGVLSGSPSLVTINQNSSVEWSGSQGNTYTGPLKVELGSRLTLKKSSGLAVTGAVELAGGRLTLEASHQISDAASIWFSTGGTFNVNGKFETVLSVYGSTYATLNLGDGTLTLAGNGSEQFGNPTYPVTITGTALSSIHKKGTGTWTLYRGNFPAAGDQSSQLHVDSGRVILQGFWQGSLFVTGGTLEGDAVTGSITNNGGILNLAKLQSSGITTPGTGGTLVCSINSATPGTGFGQLKVTGDVNLTGLTLNLSLNYIPLNLESFKIIDNDGSDTITGTFKGLPEGAILYAGGQPFRITYKGGSNQNDVVLLFQGLGLPGPEITSVRRQPDGFVRIDISWTPGKVVALERAFNNLSDWSSTGPDITLDAQGKATVLIQVFSSPKEYFRLQTRN